MGKGQCTLTEQWVDEIPVPSSKPGYPSPEPPSFSVPTLLKNSTIRDTPDNTEGKMNWKKVKEIASLSIEQQADIETGKTKPNQTTAGNSGTQVPETGKLTQNQTTHADTGDSVTQPDTNDKTADGTQVKDDTQAEAGTGVINNSKEKTGADNAAAGVEQQTSQKVSNKMSFTDIDQHAREAQPGHGESFGGLTDYLSEKLPDKRYRDVHLVRGITTWFCNQDVASLKPATATITNPAGLAQHVRNKSLSFTSAYALLIRAANIPCVIIHGLEKGGHYNPGDSVSDLVDDYWCAVYVDKSWQLIHPIWACRGTYDMEKEKEHFVLIEEDEQKENDTAEVLNELNKPKDPNNQSKDQNVKSKEQPIQFLIQEDYFMPKPEVFKYKCHPYDRKWSLLTKERTINAKEEFKHIESSLSSKEQFKMQVNLSPGFFKLNLKLISKPYSTLVAENGIVLIEFEVPPDLNRALVFSHHLSATEVEEQPRNEFLTPENMSKLVLHYRCNYRALFEISLPCKGSYTFDLKAGIMNKLYNICNVLLVTDDDHDITLLPFDAGVDGWGPGPKTQTAGLLIPTKPKGVITYQSVVDVKTKQIQARHINVNFDISRDFIENTNYTVELVQTPEITINNTNISKTADQVKQGNTTDRNLKNQMQKWITYSKDRLTRQLDIDIMIPKDGVYGLVIRSVMLEDRPSNMKAVKPGTTQDVCYYLLRPSYGHTKQGPKLKFAKAELSSAKQGDSYMDMDTAVNRCLLLGLDVTNEDIAACQVKMEYVKLKTDIEECIKRRNLSVVNDTLVRVLKYRYRAALVDDVEALLDFRKKILAIDGYQMFLPSIREAIDELYKMPHIRPEVHNTMASVLALFKHPLEKLEEWSYVKAQLRSTGKNPGHLVRQIEQCERSPTPPDIAYIRIADQILYQFTFPQVLRVNHSAATFYKWVEAIAVRLREYDRAQREYEEKKVIRDAEIARIKEERRVRKQAKKNKHKHTAF